MCRTGLRVRLREVGFGGGDSVMDDWEDSGDSGSGFSVGKHDSRKDCATFPPILYILRIGEIISSQSELLTGLFHRI